MLRKVKDNEFFVKQVADMENQIKSVEGNLKLRGNELEKKLTEFDMTH